MLQPVRLLSLDHVSLLAGTTYRGQYEERIRVIVAETTAATDVILFIDELHNLIGQGTAMGAAMDAANMLKPALVRGDFRVIGATTSDEYERWVEGDPALERRFQKVVVRELGELEALEILHARKERLERHHNVLISDEALRAAVKLTDLYVDRPHAPRQSDRRARRSLRAHAGRDGIFADERGADPTAHGVDQGPRARRARSAAPRPRPTESRRVPSAFERFGAELEALFVGAPASGRRRDQPAPRRRRARPRPSSLAPLEADLARQLMEEGVVIRGHESRAWSA